jgi:hypothetical protein
VRGALQLWLFRQGTIWVAIPASPIQPASGGSCAPPPANPPLNRVPRATHPHGSRMPNCWGAREHIWIPFMRNNMSIGADTVIVGHSSGAIAAMRFAQQYKVAGLILVATYETTLGLAMERRSEYFDTPWDWAAIRRNAGFVIQVGTSCDPLP